MNKKILSLALIPAAFFFACSADGTIPNSVSTPPAWDKLPSSQNPSNGPGGSGARGCVIEGFCVDIPPNLDSDDCREVDGIPVNNCDNY